MVASTASPPRTRRVLLIEGTAGLAFAVASVLESGGSAVRVAGTRAEGLACLRAEPFDVELLGAVTPVDPLLPAIRAARVDARVDARVVEIGSGAEPDGGGCGAEDPAWQRLPHPYRVHDLLTRVGAGFAAGARPHTRSP